MTNKDKPAATWSNVKAQLVDFDRAGLLGLVQNLYASSKDNRNFSARPPALPPSARHSSAGRLVGTMAPMDEHAALARGRSILWIGAPHDSPSAARIG
jgi:hypothetical protein